MSTSEDITNELKTRLTAVINSRVEQGFFSQYQNEDLVNERLLVLQLRTDGPCIHSNNKKKSQIELMICGAVAFNENTSAALRTLLKEVREVVFPKTERFHFQGLVVSVKETQATPFHEPKDGQNNGYFILPLTFEYTENPS